MFDDAKMCAHHEEQQEEAEYQNHLIPVAWAILVMGLSLAAVLLLYVWIGHIGPTFSSDTLQRQQQALRRQYGLPYKPIVTDPKMLQTPSERGLPGYFTNPK
jgi:hypothetical protein